MYITSSADTNHIRKSPNEKGLHRRSRSSDVHLHDGTRIRSRPQPASRKCRMTDVAETPGVRLALFARLYCCYVSSLPSFGMRGCSPGTPTRLGALKRSLSSDVCPIYNQISSRDLTVNTAAGRADKIKLVWVPMSKQPKGKNIPGE